ncbi:hypothetical protein [Streptomyces sp. NPDC046805]|uniref:hypothetical protein n=1 Tax=Streptomyces sp. NPDC046805 TaxID=3155134 RepID=UPI003410A244
MRRGLVHLLAWSLATGAAVALSWWSVHTVMAGTAYDPPRALPITAAGAITQGAQPPAPSTSRPASSAPASHRPSAPRTPAPPARTPTSRPGRPSSPAAAAASGRVKGYDTDGGRAVFDLGESSATLVSATPATGWSMQVFRTETWIRVEFAGGADRVTVFCTWHDGPPHVDVTTY